jgi:hypothetical protein
MNFLILHLVVGIIVEAAALLVHMPEFVVVVDDVMKFDVPEKFENSMATLLNRIDLLPS